MCSAVGDSCLASQSIQCMEGSRTVPEDVFSKMLVVVRWGSISSILKHTVYWRARWGEGGVHI